MAGDRDGDLSGTAPRGARAATCNAISSSSGRVSRTAWRKQSLRSLGRTGRSGHSGRVPTFRGASLASSPWGGVACS